MAIDYGKIPSPCYVLEEARLEQNLKRIRQVAEDAGVEIIMALKAFGMWSAFPIVRRWVKNATASSLAEASLVNEFMGVKAHTYAPAYRPDEFAEIASRSSHITFNSVGQYERWRKVAEREGVSCGLRVNPEFSEVETELYNPCAKGSRLGVTAAMLGGVWPQGVEGMHFHTLCESGAEDLEKTLDAVEEKFGAYIGKVKWVNMGGGHLITREGYDAARLVARLKAFKARYPNVKVILEPGSAFAWRTGELVSTVLDIVDNGGVKTAMLDVSFACHMPDCLEMPYKPEIIGALKEPDPSKPTYRMGGCSCLSGDYVGEWSFDHPLEIGERIVFADMIHYTMVKTTMFNGVSHPSIGIWEKNGKFRQVRKFGYEDYRARMS